MSTTTNPSDPLAFDDEFEDFGGEVWDASASNTADSSLWRSNWDDDESNDDEFSRQLRAELEKAKVEPPSNAMQQ
ncbi:hypothetical protein BCR33DRAFT_791441 [Rhizoclosmatium globosum]|uniref:26S proteasome complex subunit SEM1 n=1 Tax=Rhizoclosmatium globosum TaxID=329046 RepID=A0A1Y2BFE9_9FUNG|nr:hypothetical protein BCR33DRAFT_791441 [Rhizoclosmatium globosum]|eukprot:ORY33207.1 hypothetical protein BCR33DRAFT_791441 [Rhizoclosmatium globosum]